MNWMPLFPLDQERARRYKGLGSTATAFVSTREQQQDPESWRVEPWVIGSAMMVEPVSLSIFIGNNLFYIIYIYIYMILKPVSEDLKNILYKVTANDAMKLFLDIDGSRKMIRIWSSHKKVSPVAWRVFQSTVGKGSYRCPWAPGCHPSIFIRLSSFYNSW